MMTVIGYIMWYLWSAAIILIGYRLFEWARHKGSTDNYPAPDEPEQLTPETVAAWSKELRVVQRKMMLNALIWLLPTTSGVSIMIIGAIGMIFPILATVRFTS